MLDVGKLLNIGGGKANGVIPECAGGNEGNARGPSPDEDKPGGSANGLSGLPNPNNGSGLNSRSGKNAPSPVLAPFKLSCPRAALRPARPPNPLYGLAADPGAIVILLPAPIFYLLIDTSQHKKYICIFIRLNRIILLSKYFYDKKENFPRYL